jgi:DNA-binding transcriptional ArsR family regulator
MQPSAKIVHSFTNTVKNHCQTILSEDDAKMKQTKSLIAFFMILIIAFSLAAFTQRQKDTFFSVAAYKSSAILTNSPYSLLTLPTFPTPLSLEVNVAENSASVLNNSTRLEIYNFIQANPGTQFRGICNQLGISIGLAQFHLGILTKAGLITFIRDGKYKRFFQTKKYTQKTMQLIALLRHSTPRNILKTLLGTQKISHTELAHQLTITPQALTWQIKHLTEIIQKNQNPTKTTYQLKTTYTPIITETLNLTRQ